MSAGGAGNLAPMAANHMGQTMGQAMQGFNAQGQAQTPSGGAAYTPVQQGPAYQAQYQQYQPQARMAQPQYQQQSYQPQYQQAPNYQGGLQAAMMQMMQQYNRPIMRAPMQQGLAPYNNPASSYRPDMSGINANLNRVAPSVPIQQKQAAEAKAAAKTKADADAAEAARLDAAANDFYHSTTPN